MIQRSISFLRLRTLANQANSLRLFTNKSTGIDYTRVPKLNDEDLEEQFVRGSGPGKDCTQIMYGFRLTWVPFRIAIDISKSHALLQVDKPLTKLRTVSF